ncbi:cobalamin-binding protein [Mucilaginibacter conchicola]|uniref:Cobalamin-binding protein n=1 Tax=Mucilaginibacter conchicola TaxID=2303333 RepID=A0A372NWB2_9SPHI|nr:helical backbone metal receptor [Mucilaginibacter conchicola]RFZ94400.1 cobalamin-binding protein [Mucilaginibacter conchicola]
MPLFYDQMNRVIELPALPQRIISIVPSQTELLFDLGLDERIVGITKFCIHPADKVQQVTKVGGTKQLNMDVIYSLKPDLIIANKEENEQGQIEELMQHYPVWISDIDDLDSALDMINRIGELTGTTEKAISIVKTIKAGFRELKAAENRLSCAYLIWRKPYMAAGAGTFINDMLQRCGISNLVAAERYPVVADEDLQALNPEVLMLSSEPYPFSEKHLEEFKALLPNAKITLVNGELFSWYGSRLLRSPAYFKGLIENFLPNNEEDTQN